MPANSLTLRSFEPQLVGFYKSSQAKAFYQTPRLHENCFKRFKEFECELHREDITEKDYAYAVTEILKKWVIAHQFKFIPYKIFTGKWALGKYLKVADSETVSIMSSKDNEREAILYSELAVARRYIYENAVLRQVVRLGDIVDRLRPFLHQGWLELYDEHDKRPMRDAMKILNEEFGTDFGTYVELADYRILNA